MRLRAFHPAIRQLAAFTLCYRPLRKTVCETLLFAGSSAYDSRSSMSWHALGAPPTELTLDCTLPTGQSFRWRRTAENEFTGVVDSRVVKLQQLEADVQYQVIARGDGASASDDAAVLRDYFNLDACLKDLSKEWAQRDPRFSNIHQYFPGARVLRQDPVECLFEFICSSNNHILRIHGMVERLCRDYGTPLLQSTSGSNSLPTEGQGVQSQAGAEKPAVPDLAFYAFPTLEQLSRATESELRAEGFGYRAKFIIGSVAMLLAKPGGGREWLLSLRAVSYREASEALCQLPGIGPKVAACVCLFALDKHEAIPVDTHVWQLAVRYYTPHLKGKTMNKKIMLAVEDAFIDKFGPWAGWAHNTLFISELASQQERLPEHLRPRSSGKVRKAKSGAKSAVSDAASQDHLESGAQESSKSTKPAIPGHPENALQTEHETGGSQVARPRKAAGAGLVKADSDAAAPSIVDAGLEFAKGAKRQKPKVSSKAVRKPKAVKGALERQQEDDMAQARHEASVNGTGRDIAIVGRLEQQQTVASKRLGKRTRSSALAAEAPVDQAVHDVAATVTTEQNLDC